MSLIDILWFFAGWFVVSLIAAWIFGSMIRVGKGMDYDDEQ